MDTFKNIFTYPILPNTLRGIIWSFVIWIFVETLFFVISFGLNVDTNVISASIAAIAIVFGYFFTHFLEIQRKRQEKKLEQYWELLKALRIFIIEKNLNQEDKKDLVSKFQDTYFGASLFISSEAYKELKSTIEMLMIYIENNNGSNLDNFTKFQSRFVNRLRAELGEKEIEFNTYDIR